MQSEGLEQIANTRSARKHDTIYIYVYSTLYVLTSAKNRLMDGRTILFTSLLVISVTFKPAYIYIYIYIISILKKYSNKCNANILLTYCILSSKQIIFFTMY